MSNYASQRRTMVDNQLRTVDVTDLDLLDAFGAVPRERFVPAEAAALAYTDKNVQVASNPARYVAAVGGIGKLIQAAEIQPSDKVLVVGAATGYVAAVVARLAASVVALEENAGLADAARSHLSEAGAANVRVVTGPLTKGAAAEGPYNVIIVDGAVAALPEALTAQLADGGRLALVIGKGLSGRAHLNVRSGKDIAARHLFNWALPLLPGTEPAETFVF
jgi:protein-L-isoaspartate(D-aspartate) O-methyltransferase